MNVLAVIITPPVYSASGAVSAATMLSHAIARRIPLDLAIMAEEDTTETVGDLTIRRFKCRNTLGVFKQFAPKQLRTSLWTTDLAEYLHAARPDLVHLHNPVPPLELWNIAKTCVRLGIPYVITSHGFVELFDYKKSFNIGKLKSLALDYFVNAPFSATLRNAAAFFLLSPPEQPMLEEYLGKKPRSYCIPNGFDPFYQDRTPPRVLEEVALRFGLDRTAPILLFMGNHTYNKGIDTLPSSLKYTRSHFTVVIGGRIRSPEEHQALLRQCALDPTEHRYVFTDFLDKDHARALYQLADCFLFPSRADTFPLVILEAMISGLPVISTRVGGIPHQIDETCGILIEPDAPDQLALAIDRMLESEPRRKSMGAKGLQKVLTSFNWDTSAELAINAYQEVVARWRKEPAR